MRFDGRRRSSNVEDRRGMSVGKKGGLGLGGVIVVGLLMWIFGGNPLDALKFANSGSVTGGGQEYVYHYFLQLTTTLFLAIDRNLVSLNYTSRDLFL